MVYTLRDGVEWEGSGRVRNWLQGNDLAVCIVLERSHMWTEAYVQRERKARGVER